MILPLLRPSGLLNGDDTISLADKMGDYLEFVRRASHLHTVDLTLDDGVTLSIKKPGT